MTEAMTQARAAVDTVASSFVELIRASPSAAPVLRRWSAVDVAYHLTLVLSADTEALRLGSLPTAELTPAAVAVMNAAHLAEDHERDMDALADRVEGMVDEFLRVSASPSADVVPWLGGVMLPASAVACHLLEELLVHGFDLARAVDHSWRIEPAHAALAIGGGAIPIINAAPPLAFVRTHRAAGFRARIELRLRGHGRFTFVFDDGLRVVAGCLDDVDAHLSADPTCALLLMLGRTRPLRALRSGKVFAWGRRPARLPRMLQVMTPP